MFDPLAVFLESHTEGRDLVPVPLVSTDHEVTISAGLAVVTTHRLFKNTEKRNIEAALTFPLPVAATLFALVAEIDGRVLHAKAKARENAREDYELAIEVGKSAILHEELLRGVHLLSVANLGPGREIKVTTKWAMPLSVVGKRATLRIPQTVGDIYGRSPLTDADEIVSGGQRQHVSITVNSSDPVEIPGAQLINGRATLSNAQPIDLVTTLWEPRPIKARNAAGKLVSLRLSPLLDSELPLSVAVLIDRSGSMAGGSTDNSGRTAHQSAKLGLNAVAATLKPRDLVDVWQFDNQAERVGTVADGDGSALVALASTLANPGGGTEIGGAITAVLGSSPARDVLVLTDGLSHALDVETLSASGRRVSVVLIGNDSLEARIGHLAALTGGDVFIATAGDLAAVMTAAFEGLRRAHTPLVQLAQLPDQLVCTRNNVEIAASWSELLPEATNDDISRGAAAVAASLTVSCMPEALAAQVAEAEGLVTHLTSLVLIDEAGEIQETLPTMRKVALASELASMSLSYSRTPHEAAALIPRAFAERTSRAMFDLSSGPPEPFELASSLDSDWDLGIETDADLINWSSNPEALVRADLGALPSDTAEIIKLVARKAAVIKFAQDMSLQPELVAIAVLARMAADSNRHAKRVWRAILKIQGIHFESAIADLELELFGSY